MEQYPSWEANRFADSQGIPHTLWNPKVRYRIHKFQQTVSILSLINPVHTHTSHFLKIHLSSIFPSTPVSQKWSLSLRFPHQNPVHAFPLPLPCYMARPSHSSQFYHLHNSEWGVQIIKLLIMKFFPLPWYLIPLRPEYSPQNTLFSNTLSLRFSQNDSDEVSHP
jgi:hypothetical protein